jgi:nucleotide-binding universal stress UspA family protein
MEPSTLHAKPYIIVAGVDFSETGDLAVQRAFELAAQQPNAEVHLIHVARAFGPTLQLELPHEARLLSAEEAGSELMQYAERKVEEFAQARGVVGSGGFKRAVTHLRLESPAAEIAQLASDLEADLAVVGTHGRRGFSRVLLGSVAEAVVRLASCPVLVVRPSRVADASVPSIEPPCPRCVETRQETQGTELWCVQHRQRHGRRHTYHYVDRNTSSRPPSGLLTEMS